jgi:Lipoprotein LpqB beta-propeller domain
VSRIGASSRRRRAEAGGLGLALVATMAAAGCVSLPTTGEPSNTAALNANDGSAVRIWAEAPRPGEGPVQIVDDFLQAAAASEQADGGQANVAQQYLTTALQNPGPAQWDQREVLIFNNIGSVTPVPDEVGEYEFSGDQIGTVNDSGVYTTTTDTFPAPSYQFHVVLVKGQYRIDQLPPGFGVALTQADFAASYSNYNLEYLNRAQPTASMIPLPVYLRSSASDYDQADELANELFSEPNWLESIAENAVGAPTLKSLVIQPTGIAEVTINDNGVCEVETGACATLATQLLATFTGITSIIGVQVNGQNGNPLGSADALSLKPYGFGGSGPANPEAPIAYYLGANGQVFFLDGKVSDGGAKASIGPANAKYGQLSVGQNAAGNAVAALTDTTDTKLFLGTPGSTTTEQLATRYTGTAISSLSWDDFGGLWFMDTTTGGTDVYRLDSTQVQSMPQKVEISNLTLGSTIKSIAVAPDGQRLAVVVEDDDGNYDLDIAIVQNVHDAWIVDLGPAEIAANQWSLITQVAWRDSSVLGVLGSPQKNLAGTINELRADGSPLIDSATQAVVSITPLSYITSFGWAGGTLLAVTQPPTGSASDIQFLQLAPGIGTNWIQRLPGSSGISATAAF